MQTSTITGFDQIFGENNTFSPVVIGEAGRWLPASPHAMTGGQLAFFEKTPCLCHAAAATELGLGHLEEAGHKLSCELLRYRDEDQATDILKNQIRGGRKIILNHLPLPEGISADAVWVDLVLVSRLNNKAALGEWVPKQHLPVRRLVPFQEIADYDGSLPVVIKVATDGSTGGGMDLMPCRSEAELQTAPVFFDGAEWLVVEDWLNMEEVWCMNYACCHDGGVFHLGSAQQFVDANLNFLGNLFDEGLAPDESILQMAQELAQKAAAAGYVGVIGLDAGRCRDGSWFLYDINARMNASTAPLLARRKFPWLADAPMQRTIQLKGGDTLAEVVRISRRAMASKRFLPLATFDPAAVGLQGEPTISGIVSGADMQDIEDYLTKHLGQSTTKP